MKILITTDTYFPIISGVVTSTHNLHKELKEQGHDVRILTLSEVGDERIEGDIYYLKSIGIGIYPGIRIKVPFYNKLVNELIDWKPDIIHSQTEFSTMLVSKYISKQLNIPIVHTYHTMYEDYLGYLLGGKIINKSSAAKLTKFLLNTLNIVIVPTEKVKKVLQHYGVSKTIYIVPTGIDLSRFQKELSTNEKEKIMSQLNITNEDRIISYIGRIAEEKNIGEILTLFADIVANDKNIKLLIVGDGPYLKILREQVINENLSNNVIFTGMIAPDEVYKYYKLSEVFVTASTSETQGLTYLEALSCGCPVVCKYDSCLSGFIENGDTGFTYEEGSQFSYYINKVLNDNELIAKLRKNALLKANEHSSSVFADEILKIYENTLKAYNKDFVLTKPINPKA